MVMTKASLVSHIATSTSLSKVASEKVVESVLSGIKETLQKGEEVRILGFGSFAVQQSAAREGRNPRTGETIKIAASKRAVFRAGKELKDAVNNKSDNKKSDKKK